MPYNICSAGEDFQRMFHYSDTNIIGESLLKLTGPRTDLVLLRTSIESYNGPYKRDLVEKPFILYRRTGEYRHILVSFESHLEGGNAYCLLAFKEADQSCTDNSGIERADIVEQRRVLLVPYADSSKKNLERRSSLESPLIITPALLQSLSGISLPHAAKAVGISAYAFKRACRQLGICRWPYTRGPNQHNKRSAGEVKQRVQSGLDLREDMVASTLAREQPISCDASPDEGNFAEILGDCRVDEASTPCECLADGCRALEEEWDSIRTGTAEPARPPWGMAALADDRLVLEMLTQRWE